MRTLKLTGICLCFGLLAACATQPGKDQVAAQKNLETALGNVVSSNKATPATPPAAVNQALMPNISGEAATGSVPSDEHFDISVKNADAHTFFMDLVKGTRYNMVVQPGVHGRISLTLKDVTVPEVMRIVRQSYGYDYEHTRNGYVVMSNTLQTRIFQVNYLDFVRKGVSRTRVTSGQSTESSNNPYGTGSLPGASGSYPVTAGNANRQNQENQAGSEIVTKSKSDFWKDLKTSLKAIVGDKDGRQVVVNASSGVVVVRALPGELREVKHYLANVQGDADREVILEAKIIEVQLKHGFQSGINWTALGQPGSGKTIFGGQVGGTNLFPNGPNSQIQSDLNGLPLNLSPGNNITNLPSSAFGGTFALALNLNDFNAFIELLDTQGTVHVLSSPRVATVNNQKAVIKVGSDEFFVTGVYSNTFVGTSTTNNQNIILTPFFSGIALDVTPQIDDKGFVTLHIHPTVSSVTDQRKDITLGSQTQSLPLAFSEVRESDSVVRARSGQIVVIGGLMKNETQNDVAKTPILGDIPLLGQLFTQKRKRNVKTELVILLKPIVIENGRTWSNYARDQMKEFHDLSGINTGGH